VQLLGHRDEVLKLPQLHALILPATQTHRARRQLGMRVPVCVCSHLPKQLAEGGQGPFAGVFRLDPGLKPGGEAGARTTRAQTQRSSPTLVPKPFVSPAASERTASKSRREPHSQCTGGH
jgi:hypothetical protein